MARIGISTGFDVAKYAEEGCVEMLIARGYEGVIHLGAGQTIEQVKQSKVPRVRHRGSDGVAGTVGKP